MHYYLIRVVSVIFLFSVVFVQSADARVCKRKLTSQGIWTNYLAAKSSARVHWRRAVRRLHGRAYASWLKAREKRYHCVTRGISRRCKVTALPCR